LNSGPLVHAEFVETLGQRLQYVDGRHADVEAGQ
jgi:hypothetical protein